MMALVLALLPISALAAAQGHVPRAPVLADFGACIARQTSSVARALLETEVGSREEYRSAQRLFDANSGCYRDRESLSARIGEVRGIVAEALLEGDQAAMARLASRPALPAARVSAVAQGRAFVAAYAACLADAEPTRSLALLATPHHSQMEFDAFMAFGDTLNDCMPMTRAYRIDRFDVRNHIAAHLYGVAAPAAEAN